LQKAICFKSIRRNPTDYRGVEGKDLSSLPAVIAGHKGVLKLDTQRIKAFYRPTWLRACVNATRNANPLKHHSTAFGAG
jgi:hypothetical protein